MDTKLSRAEVARSVRRRTPFLDRWLFDRRFNRGLRTADPVLIYAMGNVGTTTLQASLEAATHRPVLKFHTMSKAGVERKRPTYGRHSHTLWRADNLRRELQSGQQRWTVITIVREPIARAVSTYFSDVVPVHGHTTADLHEHIRRSAHQDWFDQELKPVTGLDVYSVPFAPSAGYTLYEHNNVRTLLLRTRDIDRVGPQALADHLELDEPVHLLRRNGGGDGGAGGAYTRFLEEDHLPRSLVTEAYATRLARHFYSPDELQALTHRWCG